MTIMLSGCRDFRIPGRHLLRSIQPANDNHPDFSNDNHQPSVPAAAVQSHAPGGGHNADQQEP